MDYKQHVKNIDKVEDSFLALFSKSFKFSKNLIKYYDDIIFNKHVHNFFKYTNKVTTKELQAAYDYQRNNQRNFLKLMNDIKLNKRLVDKFKFETTVSLTMLYDTKEDLFKTNENIKIKRILLKDLNKIELKHYGESYGEDFILRRNKNFLKLAKQGKGFIWYGAYLNGEIVGSCYSYTHGKYTCLDALLVDDKYRHQYIASTIIKYIKDRSNYLYLHADEDDTPKDMYKRLGFKVVKKSYEYDLKVDI